MTQIDFYVGSSRPYDVVMQLCQKALQRQWHVRILTSNEEESEHIDQWLWTRQPLSFLPHCRLNDPLCSETPIWIGSDLTHEGQQEHAHLLINLSAEVPPFFAQFLRLAEVISQDETQKAAGRTRYAFYQKRGYLLKAHKLT
jgi:DNA polymerase-3 subunit chi